MFPGIRKGTLNHVKELPLRQEARALESRAEMSSSSGLGSLPQLFPVAPHNASVPPEQLVHYRSAHAAD